MNIMKEFKKYDCKLNIPCKTELYLDEVSDNKNGLVFVFYDPKSYFHVEIKFQSYLMYRVSDESYRLKRTYELPEFSFVMKAERSSFIEWFHEESLNVYSGDRIFHFLILSADDVIDVLSYQNPLIIMRDTERESSR